MHPIYTETPIIIIIIIITIGLCKINVFWC